MKRLRDRILFDQRDHELLDIVNEVLARDSPSAHAKKRFYPAFHPRGIKEMAESRGLRMAYAAVWLIDSMSAGPSEERLIALRSLRDEVLSAASGPLPINTARVLLQIMKELVRSHGDRTRQLQLAHDFRTTTAGKPRMVRRQLRLHHLLEMPEAWNQLAFDDHVHDANTKGRKTAAHLIMDAWIKGIRRLRVIYYNHIEAKNAAELMEAAQIMGITLRIGIEFPVRFRNHYVQLIWVPRGFPDAQSLLCFLAEENVMALMAEGRKVSEYQQAHVLETLKAFNQNCLSRLNRELGLDLPPLKARDFLSFVGPGQAALLHLGRYIHHRLMPLMAQRVADLRAGGDRLPPEEQEKNRALIAAMDRLEATDVVEQYLKPEMNPAATGPDIPNDSHPKPPLLALSPKELLDRLALLHSGYRITLNLTDLTAEDVLEILYDCEGHITRLEIFNLKDHTNRKTDHIPDIHRLQQAINRGNTIVLKRFTRDLIERLEKVPSPETAERVEKLRAILHDMATFQAFYKGTSLKSRIGSDSTGSTRGFHGMGLAIVDTLPPAARRETHQNAGVSRTLIPMHITTYPRKTYIPRTQGRPLSRWLDRLLAFIPLPDGLGTAIHRDWVFQEDSTRMRTPGNIVTLGGLRPETGNGFLLPSNSPRGRDKKGGSGYLNSRLKNILKVLLGFLPAFFTFALTKDWWLLAYCGALIWFAITGVRNILQSVLGGGGWRRSPLLTWNDYVSWDRLTDSLLFTGFSVPLLDYLVKSVLLDRGVGINTATAPVALYSVMALVNGIYLSAHNLFRGLPREAVIGNFFRSILSIPVAVGINLVVGTAIGWTGRTGIESILQKWAAVISKAASDLVAGFIEGGADRIHNIRTRQRDYEEVLGRLFDAYAQLELLHPETQALETFESPEPPGDRPDTDAADLEKVVTIAVLDLLYFWMYQPRSRSALRSVLAMLTEDERKILDNCHHLLRRQRDICQMFIDGIVGRNFSRPLAFFLERSGEYHETWSRIVRDPSYQLQPGPSLKRGQSPVLMDWDTFRDHT
ncbi:MAG: hypothetical protein JEZ11_04360 [Desulfobacterales bacterium]|nr:hypothetical protein [Desulfobacterales bacterium]